MSGSAAEASPIGVAPAEAIRFFRAKTNIPTRRWDDLWHGAHVRAWSVAGVQRDDMLADFRVAVDKALSQGTTLEEFRQDVGPLFERLGWSARGAKYVGWRTRVIYETNLRTALAAGRHAAMTTPEMLEARPFWRYRHSGKREFRPQHKAWDNLVLRHDDPFWATHDPPNGWGCGCFKQAINARELARMGDTAKRQAPPEKLRDYRDRVTGELIKVPDGIDPGWGYSVGESWTAGVVPRELAEPLRPRPLPGQRTRQGLAQLPPMPAARPSSAAPLPQGTSPADAVEDFLGRFGASADQGVVRRDASGTRFTIARELFESVTGQSKAGKRGRHLLLPLVAEALLDPDEIWLDWVTVRSGEAALRRRYLRRIAGARPALAAFEWTASGWRGVTAFPADDEDYVERQRGGVLLYRRPEE